MNDWMKQRDLLVERGIGICPSGSRQCTKNGFDAGASGGCSTGHRIVVQRPVAVTEFTPKDTPNMERTAILQQVANFTAHQQRFEREREDYFQKTMAKARSDQ